MSGVQKTIAVASGKGGVGKSTTAVNIALALAHLGSRVGLLDADIYGPSIPIMLGVNSHPKVTSDKHILPVEHYGLKIISMGFLTDENSPVIWRGPMVHGIVKQFLTQVDWGDLDYLIVDLPPGTGDAQLTLTQSAALAGAVIVTTPQNVALLDARKGLRMFQQVNVPVLGIVENMSFFICPNCQHESTIFRKGGGERIAAELGVAFLGGIPIDPAICEAGDAGKPVVYQDPRSRLSQAYLAVTQQMLANLGSQVETTISL
ncbi:MAG: Mrp/NBP35 family ATP-binding protein [Candidatus Tectomicrobia bacterium]|nr:Mrp/NBP35 family ATP-binding protein [Candidatus Tectomicrobia bacterium]